MQDCSFQSTPPRAAVAAFLRNPPSAAPRRAAVLALVLVAACFPSTASAHDPLLRISFTDDGGRTRIVDGRVIVTARDGGLLVEERDGTLWTVTPRQLLERADTGLAFAPCSADELAARLLAEFGDGFEIVRTKHYVICTNAGTQYAAWCGGLFERLMQSFLAHWRGAPLQVRPPDYPLAAIVFADERQFTEFAASDAGPASATAKGYYSIRTNRMVLYDLTAATAGRRPATVDDVNERMAAAAFNAATVVHEATHQIAFNSGLHTRYADNSLWLTEGMAMYFETPDLRNRTGWRTAGMVHTLRLRQFREYAARRPADSLATLVATDARFTDAGTATDAYAEAWALTYFLVKTRRRQYIEYLHRVSQEKPLVWNTADERLEEFQAVFGEDLDRLDAELLRYIRRLRL